MTFKSPYGNLELHWFTLSFIITIHCHSALLELQVSNQRLLCYHSYFHFLL